MVVLPRERNQVKQQSLDQIKQQLVNPLDDLIWGGAFIGDDFTFAEETSGKYAGCPFQGWKYTSKTPGKSHRIRICLYTSQTGDLVEWNKGLQNLMDLSPSDDKDAWEYNLKWWSEFWNRSRLVINSGSNKEDIGWRLGRNYQLFRYMLASNVRGNEPTVFNGGLFTFDPFHVNGKFGSGYTPDHRQWGAALTAQNQRMLVWPLLKTGDFDMIHPGFSFYMNGLNNATARVKHYWGHEGCAFEEQSAITALPGACQYGFLEGGPRGRLKDIEKGLQINKAGGMVYEAQLEYSWLILRYHQFTGADLAPYLPFIEHSVLFYYEHYQYRCKQLTGNKFDESGKLVIQPANTLEGHPNARNPTSVIAGLNRVLVELINLPEQYTSTEKINLWKEILCRLPKMPSKTRNVLGGSFLKPAENYYHKSWHCPEMYPLFPYELFGIGTSNLDLMKRTSKATGVERFKTISWHQANIHAAKLGNIKLAQKLNSKKMENGPFRFPAFWPHDIDWAPDHNWGGSGMIGLQEMVMQTHRSLEEVQNRERGAIRVLPAWPKEWDVDFKLHAPWKTIVEGNFINGKLMHCNVFPKDRYKDLIF